MNTKTNKLQELEQEMKLLQVTLHDTKTQLAVALSLQSSLENRLQISEEYRSERDSNVVSIREKMSKTEFELRDTLQSLQKSQNEAKCSDDLVVLQRTQIEELEAVIKEHEFLVKGKKNMLYLSYL